MLQNVRVNVIVMDIRYDECNSMSCIFVHTRKTPYVWDIVCGCPISSIDIYCKIAVAVCSRWALPSQYHFLISIWIIILQFLHQAVSYHHTETTCNPYADEPRQELLQPCCNTLNIKIMQTGGLLPIVSSIGRCQRTALLKSRSKSHCKCAEVQCPTLLDATSYREEYMWEKCE